MSSSEKLPIRWDRIAKNSLDEISDYIAERESSEVAQRVKGELVKLAESVNDYPRKYPKDPLLSGLEQEYRYVTKWSYKIIYEVSEEMLIIVDIFHTRQFPGKLRDKLK